MLTKSDLQQIGNVVEKSEKRIKKEITAHVTKEVGKVERKLDNMDKFLDKEIMADRRRITRIEEHLNFPQN
jgi:hypothetical protein